MSPQATRVGIAVVENDGCYLVGVRSADTALAGHHEFPGGKCCDDESACDCAVRECREETGLAVVPVRLLLNRTFDYPYGTVDLEFWLCRPAVHSDAQSVRNGFRWIAGAQLPSLNFPEANQPLISLLARQ